MRILKADFLYPGNESLIREGIVVLDQDDRIVDIVDPATRGADWQMLNGREELEALRGGICPGFINAHTHLELSHLLGQLPRHTRLPGFLAAVNAQRAADPEIIGSAIVAGDRAMREAGIVGAGDIANTDHTLELKRKSPLRYHTFIEAFDLHPDRAEAEFEKKIALRDRYLAAGLSASVAPHAPYTVSTRLLKRIDREAKEQGGPLTLHNQETPGEEAMFRSGDGELLEFLRRATPFYNDWIPTGFSSIASTLVHLPTCNNLLLVHNTLSTEEDVQWASLYSLRLWWCLCPRANRYIEDRLPDVPMLQRMGVKLTVGTDSLASNDTLSVVDELKVLAQAFPQIATEELIRWATWNGAEFFGWHRELGSLAVGTKPGLVHLSGLDPVSGALTPESGSRLIASI